MVAHHKMSMPFNKWIALPSPNSCLSEWRTRQVNLKRCIARKNRNVKVSPHSQRTLQLLHQYSASTCPHPTSIQKRSVKASNRKGRREIVFILSNTGRQSPRVKDGVVQVEMKTEQGEKGEEGGSFILRLSGRK